MGNDKSPLSVVYLSFRRTEKGQWFAEHDGKLIPASLELVGRLEEKHPSGESPELAVQITPSTEEMAIPSLKLFIVDVNNFVIACEEAGVDPLKAFWRAYNLKYPDRTTLFVAYPADQLRRAVLSEFVEHAEVGLKQRGKKVLVKARHPTGNRKAKDIDVFCGVEVAFAYGFPQYTHLTFFGGDSDYAHALELWATGKELAIVSSRNNTSMNLHRLCGETIFLEDLVPQTAS